MSDILVNWVRLVLAAIASNGVDVAPLLRQAGLTPSMLADGNARVPAIQVYQVWYLAQEQQAMPMLALDIAPFVTAGSFHALGFGMAASANLDEALQRFQRYASVMASQLRVSYTPEPSAARLRLEASPLVISYEQSELGIDDRHLDSFRLCALTTFVALLRTVIGQQLPLLEVGSPIANADLRQWLAAPTKRSRQTYLVFDNKRLPTALHGSNSLLASVQDNVVEAYLRLFIGDIKAQVAAEVMTLLAAGNCSLAAVAQRLQTNERQLQRQLKQNGYSFQQVVDEVRFDVAKRLLSNRNITVLEIALRLGFSDAANFNRAFKRWSSQSPTAWRAQQDATKDV
ncbi:helix-turn-helix domain-containing protein [Salinibius halmophilus]|uniref:helix-turn-helix domain-containing protein n=1 Tax=Salinibius halmophilus TaxID=1853216 RepID=UPI000E666A5E|nr:AraC family transcriptional regulator [Salinibius halmophilus]